MPLSPEKQGNFEDPLVRPVACPACSLARSPGTPTWLAPGTNLTPSVCGIILRDLFSQGTGSSDEPDDQGTEPSPEEARRAIEWFMMMDEREHLEILVEYFAAHVVDHYADVLVEAMQQCGCRLGRGVSQS